MATQLVRREDSDGYEHWICAQDQLNTCGAAALFMVECLVNQTTMAGGEDGVRRWLGRSESTWEAGLKNSAIHAALKRMGCQPRHDTTDARRGRGLHFRHGRLGDQRPAIVCVAWVETGRDHGGYPFRIKGGHAVVARWFTDDLSKVVILDPWQGGLSELPNDGRYRGTSGSYGLIRDIFYT